MNIHIAENNGRPRSFEELAHIALANLADRRGLTEVLGPISTGGVGNQPDNILIFTACINGLIRRGENVFDQMPYEEDIWRLIAAWRKNGGVDYCMLTLEVFYRTIFESGKIVKGFSIPARVKSRGQKWEIEELTRLGIPIHYLSYEEVYEFLREEYPPDEAARLIGLMQQAA